MGKLTEYSETYVPTYHDLVEINKKHERVHWTEDEPKVGVDVEQWKRGHITDEEKNLIANILRLFTTSDVVVGQGYYERLIPVIKNNEARNMLGSFAARECFDDQTQLLTKDGYVNVTEITMDTELAQYNIETGEKSYAKPIKLHKYEYNGVMHHYVDGFKIDLMVTPEHEIVLIQEDGKVIKQRSIDVDWSNRYHYMYDTFREGRKVISSFGYPERVDVDYDGYVYCVSVPTGNVMASRNRSNGIVTSNSIHQRAYALVSDTLGFGDDFYNEFNDYSEMVEKYEFMVEETDDTPRGFATYLAKQTMIEGINLFASFAVLFNFDRLGKMPGMCDVVRWSMIDEGEHVKGNSLLFRHYVEENPSIVDDDFKREIYETARELVRLEDAFIDKCFEMGGIEKLTAEEVKQYIRYVADYRLNQLGFKKNWGIEENPIPWIDYLMGKSFGNFFEREIVEYSKANMTGSFDDAYEVV